MTTAGRAAPAALAGAAPAVTDTATGVMKTYRNPQGAAFAPVQDTFAFPCP
jgi:hypothetical protein